jgi:hypothetical protein
VCALSTLHYFTHHNIYPEVLKGYMLQNKGLATIFQQMMMLSSVHTRGANVFHPLQDKPENNEQEEDEKAEGGRGDGDKTGLADVSWPPSDDEQTTDPFLHVLTASMDAPASALPPTFSAPSPFTFSLTDSSSHLSTSSTLTLEWQTPTWSSSVKD